MHFTCRQSSPLVSLPTRLFSCNLQTLEAQAVTQAKDVPYIRKVPEEYRHVQPVAITMTDEKERERESLKLKRGENMVFAAGV